MQNPVIIINHKLITPWVKANGHKYLFFRRNHRKGIIGEKKGVFPARPRTIRRRLMAGRRRSAAWWARQALE
jgi:hypothetical protein